MKITELKNTKIGKWIMVDDAHLTPAHYAAAAVVLALITGAIVSYIHTSIPKIRKEAATAWFSNDRYMNNLIDRVEIRVMEKCPPQSAQACFDRAVAEEIEAQVHPDFTAEQRSELAQTVKWDMWRQGIHRNKSAETPTTSM